MAAPLLLLLLLLLLGLILPTSTATWCVCRSDASDISLQKTLDYACGAGADCNPILQKGVCFQPDTIRAHCSYAANSFFQRKGQAAESCDFAGTATITTTDPSYSSCSYSTGSSGAVTTTSTAPTSTTPTDLSNGGLGGIDNGLTADGAEIDGGVLLRAGSCILQMGLIFISGIALMRELFLFDAIN